MLSSFVIVLIASTFLVQNNYYSTQAVRTDAQDNARVATEMMASEVRSAVGGGFVVAGARTLTIRSPIALAVICDRQGGGDANVHMEGGRVGLDTDEVAGVAVRDASTGAWTYANDTWAGLDDGPADAANRCFGNGADTIGARDEFFRLDALDTYFSPSPVEGDVVMLFRETTFKIQTSALDSTSWALFRGTYGQPLVEFATGIDTTARFQYRTGGTTYADTIGAGALANIDAIRIVANARKRAQTGGRDDVEFGWAVNVAVRNMR